MAALAALAKQTLGLPQTAPDYDVPAAYIDELRLHVSLYPYETEFRVVLEPNVALGAVTCLRPACREQTIRLVTRFKASDGGLSDGLGSLSAYRRHIDALHTERNAGTMALIGPLDITPPQSSAASTAMKRTRDDDSSISRTIPSSSKRTKTEVISNNHSTPRTSESKQQEIRDVIHQRADLQRRLDRLRRKPELTKAQETRSTKLELRIQELKYRKQRLEGAKPDYQRPGGLDASQTSAAGPSSGANVGLFRQGIELKPATSSPLPSGREDRKSKAEPSVGSTDAAVCSPSAVGPGRQPPRSRSPSHNSAMNADVEMHDVVATNMERSPHPATIGDVDWEDISEEDGPCGREEANLSASRTKPDRVTKSLSNTDDLGGFEGNTTVEQARGKLGLLAQHQVLRGMQVPLMAHQVVGVAWMVDQERSTLKGGCLADDMGLGKTVQMIATMVYNPSRDKTRRTTLIVAPLALLSQWALELESKTDCGLEHIIYHGKRKVGAFGKRNNKPKSKNELLSYDVVITTYGTLANGAADTLHSRDLLKLEVEWPDGEKGPRRHKEASNPASVNHSSIGVDVGQDESTNIGSGKRGTGMGLLYQIDWYRVVLDEGQNIRNKSTRISHAVSDLGSEYRWILSGTPIVNGLQDPYGMFRFLRLRPWCDYKAYQSHVVALERKNPQLAVARVRAIFKSCLLRRMKDTKLDGKPLIALPERVVELVRLAFSEEERSVYTQVETRTQNQFNCFLRAGTVLKNYHQVLVLLLRLRQCCVHPCLIQEDAVPAAEVASDVLKSAAELDRALRNEGIEFVQALKEKRAKVALANMMAEKESEDATVESEACPLCRDNIAEAVVTGCMHVFCASCIDEILARMAGENQVDGGECPCPICDRAVVKDRLYKRDAFEPTDGRVQGMAREAILVSRAGLRVSDDGLSSIKPRGNGQMLTRFSAEAELGAAMTPLKYGGLGADVNEYREGVHSALERQARSTAESARTMSMQDEDVSMDLPKLETAATGGVGEGKVELMSKFLPSTKMKYMMTALDALFKEKPDEKVIVVSQWVAALNLCSGYLAERYIDHVKYEGDMNRNARDAAVRSFMTQSGAKVMLMSLKCGGIGLNLTRANNIISLDLGWSEAVEAQAFDRVHRLGQTRRVRIERLVVDSTVEDRILALQQRKAYLANGALGDGQGTKAGRLSVKELAGLFGLNMRGERLRGKIR